MADLSKWNVEVDRSGMITTTMFSCAKCDYKYFVPNDQLHSALIANTEEALSAHERSHTTQSATWRQMTKLVVEEIADVRHFKQSPSQAIKGFCGWGVMRRVTMKGDGVCVQMDTFIPNGEAAPVWYIGDVYDFGLSRHVPDAADATPL
jgi:hypothetical protein